MSLSKLSLTLLHNMGIKVGTGTSWMEFLYNGVNCNDIRENKHNQVNTETRKPNFSFSMLRIPIGSTLTFVNDESKICYVNDSENKVMYDGEVIALSPLTARLDNHRFKSDAYQGPKWWKYNGEVLTDIRKRLGV